MYGGFQGGPQLVPHDAERRQSLGQLIRGAVMYGGFQGGPQLGPHDTERRQSLGQLHVYHKVMQAPTIGSGEEEAKRVVFGARLQA